MKKPFPTIHANALVVDETGLLIRGASRSGKSSLTLALIEEARAQGRTALLVADDRVGLGIENGALIASPHPAIAGQIERRGTGILTLPHAARARLTHVIDLLSNAPTPLAEKGSCAIEGVPMTHFEAGSDQPPLLLARNILAKI